MESEEEIILCQRQRTRFEMLTQTLSRNLPKREAAALLDFLSPRQIQRLRKKVRDHGIRGLLHGNQKRFPANRKPETLCKKVLALVKARYRDFNICHLGEKLTEVHHLPVTYTWTRRLLITHRPAASPLPFMSTNTPFSIPRAMKGSTINSKTEFILLPKWPEL